MLVNVICCIIFNSHVLVLFFKCFIVDKSQWQIANLFDKSVFIVVVVCATQLFVRDEVIMSNN